jgi:hypothetical protein
MFYFFYYAGFFELCLDLSPTKRRAIREVRLEDVTFEALRCVADLRRHGFGSMSELLPNVQRVYVATDPGHAWRPEYRRQGLEDWLRGGLGEGVHMVIEV